ncbi:MAG: MgtC/SapB family protein [Oculatellaceae cyanobacterium Prado106]|jgi:putative Mg2+ transporter-C (MgtC) family protein|nr:MgtC/SapB family protein [Oculatellaceae cyanobacterium Prado106]
MFGTLSLYPLQPVNEASVILRLCLAMLVGAIIGWERQLDRKPAGLRTHMLVSLGAAMFVLTSIQIGTPPDIADPVSRVLQGITTGIGFLGAGEIIEKMPRSASSDSQTQAIQIQGLTSAAAIWVSASLGVAIGCGLWLMGVFGAIATFVILRVLKWLEEAIDRRQR